MEFFVDSPDKIVDCESADPELAGNLLVEEALGQQAQDFALAGRKRGQLIGIARSIAKHIHHFADRPHQVKIIRVQPRNDFSVRVCQAFIYRVCLPFILFCNPPF